MRLYALFLLIILSGCHEGGSTVYRYRWNGSGYRYIKEFNYPNGKKLLMEKSLYKDGDLVRETIYNIRWPNGEYHPIDEHGFEMYRNGEYVMHNDSIRKPDNLIYQYYDSNYVEVLEVYKDGERIPFPYGHEDGYTTWQYLRNPPGIYTWKDGHEIYVRPFTDEEWGSHKRMNDYLNYKGMEDTVR